MASETGEQKNSSLTEYVSEIEELSRKEDAEARRKAEIMKGFRKK